MKSTSRGARRARAEATAMGVRRGECGRAAELGGSRWISLEWVRWAGLFDGPFFQSKPTVLLYSFLLDVIYVFV